MAKKTAEKVPNFYAGVLVGLIVMFLLHFYVGSVLAVVILMIIAAGIIWR